MALQQYSFQYEIYDSIDDLEEGDAQLLRQARMATANAYVPYSHFHVGAAARLANGEILTGSNQENASYSVVICAERVLLSAASAVYPNVAITTMAISYHNEMKKSDHPISPCGVCRQSLQEYETRSQSPIRLILGGEEGKVYVVDKASSLLPLSFTKEELVL